MALWVKHLFKLIGETMVYSFHARSIMPVVILVVFMILAFLLASSSVVAPFIYTVF